MDPIKNCFTPCFIAEIVSREKSMCSLFSSIVYLTLDAFYRVGKPFILLITQAMFTAMVRGSLQLWSREKVMGWYAAKNNCYLVYFLNQ